MIVITIHTFIKNRLFTVSLINLRDRITILTDMPFVARVLQMMRFIR